MTIRITTLKNGLRIITDTVTAVDSVALGVWSAVGTRHEDMAVNGIAHMVEHMMFKGTKTRSAGAIAEQIEDVGGSINAYTSREVTAYHIHVLKDHVSLAVDLLADLIQNSIMPEDEIERERAVILQEIGMSMDTPDDFIFDNYQETAYPGQALGAPILGKAEIVSRIGRDSMMNYVRNCYTPERLVISAAGNIDHDSLVTLVERYFPNLPPNRTMTTAMARYEGGDHRQEKPLEQSHILMGFQSVSRHHPRHFSTVILSTILGGGMSSRLFQEVREKRGLVYSVFSFDTAYEDDGQFGIYAGTGPESIPELIPVVCEEIMKVVQEPVKQAELVRAKTQLKSSILMGRESMMTRAGQQAKHLIHFKTQLDIDGMLRDIDAVCIDSVQETARAVFSSHPTIAGLGPLKSMESYDEIARRLAA